MPAPDEPRAPDPPVRDAPGSTPLTPPITPVRPSSDSSGPGLGHYVITAVIALGCGLGGAYLYQKYIPKPGTTVADQDQSSTRVSDSTLASTEGGSARPSEPVQGNKELADRLNRLDQQFDVLSKQVDGLGTKPQPDLSALRVDLSSLTDTTRNLAPLPSKLEMLSSRVSDLSGMLVKIRGDVVSLQSKVDSDVRQTAASTSPAPAASAVPPDEKPGPKPASSPRPTSESRPAEARPQPDPLAKAADLFRRGQYQKAADEFNALALTRPDDARVWYYAALARGFATGEWTGGTVELVERGITCEQTGTPTRATIDDAFKDLTTATGRDWLASYRQRAQSTSAGTGTGTVR